MKNEFWTRNFNRGLLIVAAICMLPLPVAFGQATYKITDLGSLGGGSSYSYSQGINERGQVVGESSLPDGSYHAFIYTGGKMRELGIGANPAYAINNQGEVVGEYNGQAFIYSLSSGKIQMLGILFVSQFQGFSYATCINNSGEVAGTSTVAGLPTDYHLANHAFLYSHGKMRDLGTLGYYSLAYGINNRGQVVGSSSIPTNITIPHAILYSGGNIRDLGTLSSNPSANSVAYSINDHGQIVGSSATGPSGGEHAFFYSGTKMRDLGTLGGQSSTANCINNSGEVVGSSDTAAGGQAAFLYRGGQMLDLNTLITPNSAPPLASATSINDAGQIVAGNDTGRLFLLTPVRPGIRPWMLFP